MSKLTTDVVTYCTEASNQKSKYAYRKIFFYKKSTAGGSRFILEGLKAQACVRRRGLGLFNPRGNVHVEAKMTTHRQAFYTASILIQIASLSIL